MACTKQTSWRFVGKAPNLGKALQAKAVCKKPAKISCVKKARRCKPGSKLYIMRG